MQELGALNKVPVREIWPDEAQDFTPWLAGHLEVLADATGMDLETIDLEAAVGRFSLDILAREVGQNRTVAIENQLDATNHDHLGKLLTYAAGHDADVAIWVAPEFRDEHRAALEWLNRKSANGVDFFGVAIQVFRIGSSTPAPNFDAVVVPTDWPSKRDVSSRGLAYRSFFQTLIDELREVHGFTGARKGGPNHWHDFATGTSRVRYRASFTRGARVRVEVYVDVGEKEKNLCILRFLETHQGNIEAQINDDEIEWEELPSSQACQRAIRVKGLRLYPA